MYIYKSQIPSTLMLKMTSIKFPLPGVPLCLIFLALQFHTIYKVYYFYEFSIMCRFIFPK